MGIENFECGSIEGVSERPVDEESSIRDHLKDNGTFGVSPRAIIPGRAAELFSHTSSIDRLGE